MASPGTNQSTAEVKTSSFHFEMRKMFSQVMHDPHPTPLNLVTNLSFKQTANTRKRYERVTPTAPITHINFFYIINLLLEILTNCFIS